MSYEILFYFSIACKYSVKKWKGFKGQPVFLFVCFYDISLVMFT